MKISSSSPSPREDSFWDSFGNLFQFASGKNADISWYTDYARDIRESNVNLDQLVRDNELWLSQTHPKPHKVTKSKLRRNRRQSLRPQNRKSPSLSSEKQPFERSVSQTRAFLSSGTNKPSPVKSTQNAPFENRQNSLTRKENSSNVTTNIFQSVSLRHVALRDESDVKHQTNSHFSQNQESPLRIIRVHSKERVNDGRFSQHRRSAEEDDDDDDDDEPLKSPVVSDLVSRFENVNRSSFSSRRESKRPLINATLEPKTPNGHRHSLRVITSSERRKGSVDGGGLKADGRIPQVNSTSNQDLLPALTPTSTRRSPLTKMKSESSVRQTTHDNSTPNQYSRSFHPEPRSLTKELSMDSATLGTPQFIPQSSLTGPGDNGSLGASITIHKLQLNTNAHRSNSLPKLRSNHQPSVNNTSKVKTISETAVSEVPQWRSEVELRKKTKAFVPSHKTEQSIEVFSTPEWKKQLMEKNRQKRSSAEVHSDQLINRKTTINYTEPLWKQEFEKIRRHQSSRNSNPLHFQQVVPEWVLLAEQRRNSRFIQAGKDDDH